MLPASSKHSRRIALVDCNNFYASCERLFQPAWMYRPIGVLSNNDGCLVARSNELKEAGIPMGAPYFKVKDQLNTMGAIVVSSNYALYGDMSARVMDTLGQFTPDLEIYSIDEAWLDLSDFNSAILDGYAREIASTTHQCTGIPVSVGIAPTKVLAKIANRICKQRKLPGQVFNLGDAAALDTVLSTIAVQDVWGIGSQWSKKLKASGIHTARQLRDADEETMRQRFSVVMHRIILELRGVPCLGKEDVVAKKQIIASRSFGDRVTDCKTLMEAVSMHATRAGQKLRQQGSVCGAIQVSIRTGRHNPNETYFAQSTQIRFSVATADTRKLIAAAKCGVRRIYKHGPRYAKAGVMLLDLGSAHQLQMGLFEEGDNDKSIQLMDAIDRLNRCFGKKTVYFASEGIQKAWAMKRNRMTKAYTTDWEDLLEVR